MPQPKKNQRSYAKTTPKTTSKKRSGASKTGRLSSLLSRWSGVSTPVRALSFMAVFAIVGGGIFLYMSRAEVVPEADHTSEVLAQRYTTQLVNTAKKLQKSPGDPKLTKQLQDVASERKQAMVNLIAEDPEAANRVVFPDKLRASLPADVNANIESPASAEGTLEVLHGEQFDEKDNKLSNPFYEYTLRGADNRTTKLHFKGEGPTSAGGGKIKVKGLQLGADMATTTQDVTVTSPPPTVAATTAMTPSKVAVILLNFSDNTTQPWTTDQVKASVFGATKPSDNNYYEEQSFNKVGLTGKISADGDVFGWYRIANTTTTCDYGTWSTNAAAAAKAAGIDLTGYDHIIYAFPYISSCGWGGMGQTPGSTTWINGYATHVSIVGHELGHNFGAHHSSSYTCKDSAGATVTISTSCTQDEYGDIYDIMGGGSFGSYSHMNIFHKGRVGYLAAGNTQTVTTSGTYNIAPLETGATGTQALRIPVIYSSTGAPTMYYYLEYRKVYGYDSYPVLYSSASSSVTANSSNLTNGGILVHMAPDYTTVQTKLLDMNPSTSGNFQDAGLITGMTFNDPVYNLSITTQSMSDTGATVQITKGAAPCVRAKPGIAVSPVSQWANAGDTLSYTATITNNDSGGCSAGTFSLTSQLPAGVTQSPATTQLSIAAGASASQAISVNSAPAIAGGYYSFTEIVSSNGSQASATANYNVYGAADTIAPTASISSPASGAKLGNKTNIAATGKDNIAVTSMEIYIDGTLVRALASSSITYSWNSRSVSRGTHTITVKAYDAVGNSGSTSVSVTK